LNLIRIELIILTRDDEDGIEKAKQDNIANKHMNLTNCTYVKTLCEAYSIKRNKLLGWMKQLGMLYIVICIISLD
jgi:hypothetical protein